MDQIRAANPIMRELPAPAIGEVWRRIDADGEQPQLHRDVRAHTSARTWLAGIGGVMVAISATAAVAIAVLAIVLVGHGRSGTSKPSTPSAATNTAVRGSTMLPLGSAIGPPTAAQNTDPGAAVLSTVRLVVQTPDPRGGLPWGMREFQTTRGQTCIQVGRVQNGTIGVIGQDGAWANDHRFHTISPNAFTADYCSETDGNGDAFENVMQASESASGGAGLMELGIHGCGLIGAHGDPCRKADLRVLQYGLLGPDVRSITYLGAGGRSLTEPTSGPDGGYLIVVPATKRLCRATWRGSGCGREAGGAFSAGSSLESGLVTTVRYHDGHLCRVPAPPPWGSPAGTPQASCPIVGYLAPRVGHLTAPLLAAPVTVRKLPSRPVVDISFTARVAVRTANSYYEYTLGPDSHCSNQTGDNTHAIIRAGQRVVLQDQIMANCSGVLRGTVAYVPNVGPGGSEYPGRFVPSQVRSIVVGQFSLAIR